MTPGSCAPRSNSGCATRAPLIEQAHGVERGRCVEITALLVRTGQPLQAEQPLAGPRGAHPRGHQHTASLARKGQAVEQVVRLDQILRVVEHQQRASPCEPAFERAQIGRVLDIQVQHLCQPGDHLGTAVQIVQRNPDRAVRELLRQLRQCLARQAALADAARAHQRHQPMPGVRQQFAQRGQLMTPTDEVRAWVAQRRHRRHRCGFLHRRAGQRAQFRRRLDAQLLGQSRGVLGEDALRLRRHATSRLGAQQRRHRAFIQRVGLQHALRQRHALRGIGQARHLRQRGPPPGLRSALALLRQPLAPGRIGAVVQAFQQRRSTRHQGVGCGRVVLAKEGADVAVDRPAQTMVGHLQCRQARQAVQAEDHLAQVAPALLQRPLGPQQAGNAVARNPLPAVQRQQREQLEAALGHHGHRPALAVQQRRAQELQARSVGLAFGLRCTSWRRRHASPPGLAADASGVPLPARPRRRLPCARLGPGQGQGGSLAGQGQMSTQELKAVAPAAHRLFAPEHDMKGMSLAGVVVRGARRLKSPQCMLESL
jgi:hypothetical protein